MNGRNRSQSAPLALILLLLLNLCPRAGAKESFSDIREAQVLAAAALFSNGAPLRIDIRLSDADVQALKKDNRKYVRATVFESNKLYAEVGLHLKGAAGSFRQLEEKPAFTLSFNQFKPEQRFHGLRDLSQCGWTVGILGRAVRRPRPCRPACG